ncbi:MAG: 50S ribosomal protein L11 methyltransferase [Desulfobacterales bacterium]|uniref:50S ribosomal protein L11 methyltransferase n=1 Tax=Candidatus Desulfatibia profunda TaxID=2841695 RepID=A0A8J6NTJ0_9BACT|nr:50S ribosomal protein L11 methyltransferase [Candidatus Desulfatibia profunda]MBL7180910.1 50S ribosomal protein L11 methyltransferase [Desulfobacterales bacterium]
MSSTGYVQSERKTSFDSPYKDLFIYYLHGQVVPDQNLFDPDFIGCWPEDEFSFLFFSRPARAKVEKLLNSQPRLTLLDEFQMTYDQWQGGRLAPFRVGRFHIAPPWQMPWNNQEISQEELPIVLDPGVVFGTGTHPTTCSCLEALELVFGRAKIVSALDLGTGTGLLALAASRLGSPKTLAVDLNFLAVNTAIKNVRLNRLQDSVLVVQGRAEDFIDSPSDLVIANIHYEVMKHLIQAQGFCAKKWFILSGLLRTQAKDIASSLSRHPFQIIKKWEQDGIWHTFFGKIG